VLDKLRGSFGLDWFRLGSSSTSPTTGTLNPRAAAFDTNHMIRSAVANCAHRGTSLEWGRIEQEGLRCCYHGWLYDIEGRCIDMPCETEEFRKAMDVWQPAYPTTEYGGSAAMSSRQ
jgi:nitrite reductase/ring-hydroxylating ferredoxin subunit